MAHIRPEELVSEKYLDQPEPPNILDDRLRTASLATVAAHQPFLPPRPFDNGRFQYLMSVIVKNAEYHVWSLHEQPLYFEETFYETCDLDPALLHDSSSKQPDLSTKDAVS